MWTDLDRRYLKARLDNIERMLGVMFSELMQTEETTMAKLEDVAGKVSEQGTVIEGVTVLLDTLSQQIKEAGTDPAKLDEIVANIQANTDKLAAAVARDTAADQEATDAGHAAGM